MCPVIVTFDEVVPGFFEFIFPFAQAKEGIKGGNGDLYTIVAVGFPGTAGNAQQFIAEFHEFGFQGLQIFQGFFFVATAFGFAAEGVDGFADATKFRFNVVVDAGVEGLIREAVVVEPEGVATGAGREG